MISSVQPAAALAAACLLLGCGSDPTPAAISAALGALMSDLHAHGLFNGAIVVGQNGTVTYEGAFGPANVAAGVPFTPDTPVDGASLAKTFTAAAVWMLVDEGTLDADAPVRRYLPEYPHTETTIRHLIDHSGGLGEWYDQLGQSTAQLVDTLRVRGTPPAFPPGLRFSYCNACFDVAALVVERVSGLRYDAFLRHRIFTPLGMSATFLRPQRFADWPGVRTQWYSREAGTMVPHDVTDNEGFYGSSNLYFSTRDLERWAASFYLRPVLSPSALNRGNEVAVFGTGESAAMNRLNWYYSADQRRFYFNGHLDGLHTEVYWDKGRRHSFAWASNIETKLLPQVLNRAVIDILEGRVPERIAEPISTGPGPGESLTPVEGTYDLGSLGRLTIRVDGDRARLRFGDGAEHESFRANGLYVPDFDAKIGLSDFRGGRYHRIQWTTVFRVVTGTRQ